VLNWFKKKPEHRGPDFSHVNSREKAEEMARRGELEAMYLVPLEFGGARRRSRGRRADRSRRPIPSVRALAPDVASVNVRRLRGNGVGRTPSRASHPPLGRSIPWRHHGLAARRLDGLGDDPRGMGKRDRRARRPPPLVPLVASLRDVVRPRDRRPRVGRDRGGARRDDVGRARVLRRARHGRRAGGVSRRVRRRAATAHAECRVTLGRPRSASKSAVTAGCAPTWPATQTESQCEPPHCSAQPSSLHARDASRRLPRAAGAPVGLPAPGTSRTATSFGFHTIARASVACATPCQSAPTTKTARSRTRPPEEARPWAMHGDQRRVATILARLVAYFGPFASSSCLK
jgi:hypothetical protein